MNLWKSLMKRMDNLRPSNSAKLKILWIGKMNSEKENFLIMQGSRKRIIYVFFVLSERDRPLLVPV